MKILSSFKKLRGAVIKRATFVLIGVVIFVAVMYFVNKGEVPFEPKTPPVTVAVPEVKVVSVDPAPGDRQTIDGFTSTAFEFSSPIKVDLVQIQANPYIALKKTVYQDRPNILYVEPQAVAWTGGLTYTITIKKGVIGVNGEELKEDVVYTFSNTPPEYIDLPGPI